MDDYELLNSLRSEGNDSNWTFIAYDDDPSKYKNFSCTHENIECIKSVFNNSSYLEPDDPPLQLEEDLFRFFINGLGITVVAILGIIGNGLSAIVLSRPQMKSSVTCLLLGLAFCDTLLISISILIYSLPHMCDYAQHSSILRAYRLVYYPLWVPYLFPISITAQTASVYLTLAVTIERYIAVCHSLRARSICTWRRACLCVCAVLLFAITYNLPRWWEVRTDPVFDRFNNVTIYVNSMSWLRSDQNYINIYINWAYLVVMYLIPFSGLVIFNLAIYRQVRRANKERAVLTKLQRREMGLATMLLCVVVVFLMCNVLPLVNNILECFYEIMNDELVATSNFLVIVNSSVNFVIYCTCGERFRRLLLRMCRDCICCGSKTRNSVKSSNYRKSHHRSHNEGCRDLEETVAAHTCTTGANGRTGNGSIYADITHEKCYAGGNARRTARSVSCDGNHQRCRYHHHSHHHPNGSHLNNSLASVSVHHDGLNKLQVNRCTSDPTEILDSYADTAF